MQDLPQQSGERCLGQKTGALAAAGQKGLSELSQPSCVKRRCSFKRFADKRVRKMPFRHYCEAEKVSDKTSSDTGRDVHILSFSSFVRQSFPPETVGVGE